MLSDSVSRKKIKPAIRASSLTEGDSAFKMLAFLVFYLYCLIVFAVYDFTVIGLIAAIVLPAGLFFLFFFLTDSSYATISQCSFFFFVITLFFLFLKNIISIVGSIRDLFKYTRNIFSLVVLAVIMLVPGILFLFFKSLKSTVIGFSLCGFAIALCLFHRRGGFFISNNGLKFLVVYAVFIFAYCVFLKISDNAYSESGFKDEQKVICAKKYKKITNPVMLLMSVAFAFLCCAEPDLLRWENVRRFTDIMFSLAIMIPAAVVFCVYFVVTNYAVSINLLDADSGKKIRTELKYIKTIFMLYVLCAVLYRHYFTFNFLLLLVFFIIWAKKDNIDLGFVNLVALDILVSTGRTETAIVIGIFEYLFIRMYRNTVFALTKRDNDHKPIYVPSDREVFDKIISRKPSWVLAIVSITAVMASFLLHTKSPGATRASFIGFIGAPDWKLLIIMAACAALSILANNLLMHSSELYKHRYAYSVAVLILLFVSCLVVIKKDTTFFRIDPDEEIISVTLNQDGADIESVAFYRGSNIPFTTAHYSGFISAGDIDDDSFTVYYPRAGAAICERMEFLIEDENRCYTTYDCYYPLALYGFFELE